MCFQVYWDLKKREYISHRFKVCVHIEELRSVRKNRRKKKNVFHSSERHSSLSVRLSQVPLLIPCHRVISSSGQSGPYMSGKGDHLKQWLLTHERQRGES